MSDTEKNTEKTTEETTENKDGITADNFIEEFILEDLAPEGRCEGMTVHTRFPPEPNGYLHIGHAKAICINFGIAEKFNGLCNLRMDDTNPVKEDEEYVRQIKEDIHWLGFDWEDRFYHASDYFEDMYGFAEELIRKGLAYVDEQSAEEIRRTRGTLTEAGKNSPYRDRPAEESLDLFRRMRAGEFADGEMVLRAKIDMASGNMNMRDPVIYRINHASHHQTGDKWCIYPMYDFAHPIEDAMEHITHSLCSIEFEDHRPLYNWVRDHVSVPSKPRQIEFARLGMNYTVMSKRKLRALVEEGLVDGWADPRMPTLSGLRRRGYTPAAIRNFIDRIGVSKTPNVVEHAFLEYCLREDLNKNAPRAMVVMRPVELLITNYPEGKSETFDVINNPERPEDGTRKISFSRRLWIEDADFLEEPIPKYRRLYPGNEVRLREAYVIRCTGCEKDEDGNIIRVLATYDPETRGGSTPDGRKIRSTIHWVDQESAVPVELRLYDKLFTEEDPDSAEDYHDVLNPNSLEILENSMAEASLKDCPPGANYQFMRQGYFTRDSKAEKESGGKIVFNRSVSLRDSFKLPAYLKK